MLSISLGDILKALDQFKAWPRIQAAPDRLDALEKRIAELEARLNAAPTKPKGEPCEYCHAGSLALVSEVPDPGPFGRLGRKVRTFKCDNAECGKTMERFRDP